MAEIKYLTLSEAAAILSVSARTLSGLAMSGRINAFRIPSPMNKKSRWRFLLSDLENFMNENKFLSVNVITKNVFLKNNKARININVEKIKKALEPINEKWIFTCQRKSTQPPPLRAGKKRRYEEENYEK